MFIIIFFIILGLLILVHEFGHFIFAKMAGVRVDEFGFGYPPRMFRFFRAWNTDFTLNWVPFGGFVKIFGENYVEDVPRVTLEGRKFTDVNKIWQILILGAGVFFNFLFAWALLSSTFILGTPYPVDGEFGSRVTNPQIIITNVIPGMPAEKAGLKAGDAIENFKDPETLSNFISNSPEKVSLQVRTGNKEHAVEIVPVKNETSQKFMIGIEMDKVGTLKLGVAESLKQGLIYAYTLFISTILGLGGLILGLFRGHNDLSGVAGPVGIVSLVGEAYKLGFVYLLSFTAFISINLAVVNLIPFPALDGGRILMVIIEKIKGSRVNPKIFNTINTIGFAILIIFMIVVTFHDIVKLF